MLFKSISLATDASQPAVWKTHPDIVKNLVLFKKKVRMLPSPSGDNVALWTPGMLHLVRVAFFAREPWVLQSLTIRVRVGGSHSRETNSMALGHTMSVHLEDEIKHTDNQLIMEPQKRLWTPKPGWASLVGDVPCIFLPIDTRRVTWLGFTEREKKSMKTLHLELSWTLSYVSLPLVDLNLILSF